MIDDILDHRGKAASIVGALPLAYEALWARVTDLSTLGLSAVLGAAAAGLIYKDMTRAVTRRAIHKKLDIPGSDHCDRGAVK